MIKNKKKKDKIWKEMPISELWTGKTEHWEKCQL